MSSPPSCTIQPPPCIVRSPLTIRPLPSLFNDLPAPSGHPPCRPALLPLPSGPPFRDVWPSFPYYLVPFPSPSDPLLASSGLPSPFGPLPSPFSHLLVLSCHLPVPSSLPLLVVRPSSPCHLVLSPCYLALLPSLSGPPSHTIWPPPHAIQSSSPCHPTLLPASSIPPPFAVRPSFPHHSASFMHRSASPHRSTLSPHLQPPPRIVWPPFHVIQPSSPRHPVPFPHRLALLPMSSGLSSSSGPLPAPSMSSPSIELIAP